MFYFCFCGITDIVLVVFFETGNKRITDASFKFIDKKYPNINHIYMADCKGITDDSLKSLSPLKQLTVLNLANCVR